MGTVITGSIFIKSCRSTQASNLLRLGLYSIIFGSEELRMSDPTPASDLALMDINGIMRVLPHRYPFLLIDRIVEHKPKERIVAIKNVTMNEPFFAGHFEGYPIMPGVLVVEAMAQAGGVLLMSAIADPESKLLFFAGIEKARFRQPVVPGDQLRIEVDVKAWRMSAGRMEGKAFVGNKRVAEALISCVVVPRKPADQPATEAG